MKPALVWVVGGGGLLGKHLVQATVSNFCGAKNWVPEGGHLLWGDKPRLHAQIRAAIRTFSSEFNQGYRCWIVMWAAGAGVVGASSADMAAECEAFDFFLTELGLALGRAKGSPRGLIFLASSAGGVYGGSQDIPISEASPCEPISDYGRSKLTQENRLVAFAEEHNAVAYLIGRIANLYGRGQNFAKPQGVISHVSRAILFRRPINIYVSTDTMRDYLYAPDCARDIVRCMSHLEDLTHLSTKPMGVMKIFGSGETSTIAKVIGIFSKAVRQHPPILWGQRADGPRQPSRLHFMSQVWPEVVLDPKTPLSLGIPLLHRFNLELFLSGRMPPPKLG